MLMRLFVQSLTFEERAELTKALHDFTVLENGGLTKEEKTMSVLEAIKSVRNRTGLGLLMAKEIVQRDRVQNRLRLID